MRNRNPIPGGKQVRKSLPAFAVLCLAGLCLGACGPMVRPYFVRSAGGYVMPTAAMTPTAAVPDDLPDDGDADATRLRKIAEAYLGVPYRLGGQSRSGMDCSGFIRQVFAETYNLNLPHSSGAMSRLGAAVDRRNLKPGDLVFFKSLGFVDHGGIYIGGDYFIHSATSVGVSYSSLDAPYFASHYAGARRVVGGSDSASE